MLADALRARRQSGGVAIAGIAQRVDRPAVRADQLDIAIRITDVPDQRCRRSAIGHRAGAGAVEQQLARSIDEAPVAGELGRRIAQPHIGQLRRHQLHIALRFEELAVVVQAIGPEMDAVAPLHRVGAIERLDPRVGDRPRPASVDHIAFPLAIGPRAQPMRHFMQRHAPADRSAELDAPAIAGLRGGRAGMIGDADMAAIAGQRIGVVDRPVHRVGDAVANILGHVGVERPGQLADLVIFQLGRGCSGRAGRRRRGGGRGRRARDGRGAGRRRTARHDRDGIGRPLPAAGGQAECQHTHSQCDRQT